MNQRTIAILQVALGVIGLTICIGLFFNYSGALRDGCRQMDALAGDAQAQAETADQVLDQWRDLLLNLDGALTTHQRSLAAVEHSRSELIGSIDDWRQALGGFATVTKDAASVCDKFAGHLPLRVPKMEYETRELQVDIPQFKLQEESVRLPYPTARVGSRKVQLDLGLTKVDLDVPTINIGSREKVIKVPQTPDVSTRTELVSIPQNVRIEYDLLLQDERDLLTETATQMRSTSATLSETSEAVAEIQALMQQDLAQSLTATASNLTETQLNLRDSYETQIPEFQRRLRSEARGLGESQTTFQRLEGLVPWLFLLLGIVPLAVLLQGWQGMLRARVPAAS